MLPAPSLHGNDCIKLSDDVVANDRHVESTCDRIATFGTQVPSQVSEIQRLVDGTGLRKHQSLALLLQLLCARFQRVMADAYALIVGPADIGSMVLLIAAALRLPSRSLNTPSRFASIKRLTVSFIMGFYSN